MMTEAKKNPEKPISEQEFDQLWQGLTHNQRRFAVAMLDSPTKKDAALGLGIEPVTVYGWPDTVDRAIELLLEDAREGATSILINNVVKAAMTKARGLDSDDERSRQASATEILDRVLGRAAQPVTGKEGGAIVFAVSGIDLEEDI